jgi:hypothetical protein
MGCVLFLDAVWIITHCTDELSLLRIDSVLICQQFAAVKKQEAF